MEFRRARTEGATYFFTVVAEHRRPLLVENVERLRKAFRVVRAKRPFTIDAVVVLPDHLHSLWTLPEGDSDYAGRWMAIKRNFSSGLPAMPSTASQ
ncbi:REP-associated tyrosine transposase, partial [Endothiovibrio diazotrophicus]